MAATLPNVSSPLGTPMGRKTRNVEPKARVHLRRIRINQGGYDECGAYWGLGPPLYHACDYTRDGIDIFFRAPNRAEAKAHVAKLYPGAMFYR